jgi:hypothetical protein
MQRGRLEEATRAITASALDVVDLVGASCAALENDREAEIAQSIRERARRASDGGVQRRWSFYGQLHDRLPGRGGCGLTWWWQ